MSERESERMSERVAGSLEDALFLVVGATACLLAFRTALCILTMWNWNLHVSSLPSVIPSLNNRHGVCSFV